MHGNFFRSKDKGSQFWRSLHRVKHLFKKGVTHVVRNGKLTDFWEDVWLTSARLRICFPKIYNICYDGYMSVAKKELR
jgi:hypothetical protein